jgi:RHS repeat-associated protein
MIVNKSGALNAVKRHDYLPFGEELYAGTGGRTTTQGYTGDSVRQKFTSQERDNETGLDYMHARYFASAQGRFSSADTVAGSIANPQTLNLYAYVQNNPLAFSDPTGHISDDHGLFGALNDPWSEIPWTVVGSQQQQSKDAATAGTEGKAEESSAYVDLTEQAHASLGLGSSFREREQQLPCSVLQPRRIQAVHMNSASSPVNIIRL